jgi:hypothetical protein
MIYLLIVLFFGLDFEPFFESSFGAFFGAFFGAGFEGGSGVDFAADSLLFLKSGASSLDATKKKCD